MATRQCGRMPRYTSFWLRCWQLSSDGSISPMNWRFSLEDPERGQKQGFDNLQLLCAFVESELEREAGAAAEDMGCGDL